MLELKAKSDLSLLLFLNLDELRAGKLEGKQLGQFTKHMLIGGKLIDMLCGMNMRMTKNKLYGTWLNIAAKFDDRNENRMVCNGDQLQQVTKFVFMVDKVVNWASKEDLLAAINYVDNECRHGG